MITSKNREEYKTDFSSSGLDGYFDTAICAGDSDKPKSSPALMLRYLEQSKIKKEEAIYIGDTFYGMQRASSVSVAFGLALQGCHCVNHIHTDYYFDHPTDTLYLLSIDKNKRDRTPWVRLATELQFLAQGGLCYSKDPFDIERSERTRETSAEMVSLGSGYPLNHVKSVFYNEIGFRTPKLDTRAAISQKDKALLAKEKNSTWSLPGGRVDVYEFIKTNTVKEVKEGAELDVIPIRPITV